MGIDRIGKAGPPVPVPETGGPAAARPTGPAFQVPEPTAPTHVAPAHVDATQAAGPLERLRAGEVDLGGYVDLKVREATAHLSGLPAVELDRIRSVLRERLASDPALIDLLHTATGETLPPDGD